MPYGSYITHTEIKRCQAKGEEEMTTNTWLGLVGNGAELLAVSRAVPIGMSQARNCVGWMEALVSLLFPFLSLVWFWWNSHSLEVVSLLLMFSSPSSSLPKSSSQSWGAFVLGWTCTAWCATPVHSHQAPFLPPHSICPSHLSILCIPFCGGFLLLVIPGHTVFFSSGEAWDQLSHEARGRSKVTSDLQTVGLFCGSLFLVFVTLE